MPLLRGSCRTLFPTHQQLVVVVSSKANTHHRLFASVSSWGSSTTLSTTTIPFYGAPPPHSSRHHNNHNRNIILPPPPPTNSSFNVNAQKHNNHHHYLARLTPTQRLAAFIHSSITAIRDPSRADCVAAVGEVTGSYALSCMLHGMKSNVTGHRILIDRPLVDDAAVHRAANAAAAATTTITEGGGKIKITSFGQAYTDFLRKHSFDPNDRSYIKYLHDPELAYVMTRYRQCHDYFHVLTGLPPTVLGELGLKLLELMQTGLPLAALSVTSATISGQLSPREKEVLWSIYLPWAVRVGRGTMKEHGLMCVYYEEEFDTELDELRERMGIEVAPSIAL